MADVVKSDADATLAQITESQGFYSSLALDTRAQKLTMLRAINNSVPLVDKVGSEVAIADVVMQTVQIANEQTGEIEGSVRITIVDPDGNAFHATSKGLAQSLRQVFNLFGEPSWKDDPIKANVLERRGRNGFRYITLDFVE